MIVIPSFIDFCRPLDTLSLFQTSAFKSLATESDSQLPYAAKQMLARELALERMRRAEATYAQPSTSPQNTRNSTEGVKSPPAQRKAAPMPDSFMAARLAPTAAPLTAPIEKKVRFIILQIIIKSLYYKAQPLS